MDIEWLVNDMTHTRFLALTPSYEEVYQALPPELQEEYSNLSTKMERMPQGYEWTGDYWIDWPLLEADQIIWDRYAEISAIGKDILKQQWWVPKDPVTKTLLWKIKLRTSELLWHSPNNFGVY